MASKSKLSYLEGEVREKVNTILARSEILAGGTEASDRMADLLRNLSSALTDYGTQSVDIRNQAAQMRG
jgi:hypothetical protein